jgi:single-stranded-DNA-specific exonuclease
MFYVLLATRAQLRQRSFFTPQRPEPKLDGLLPLVALGTVADVVSLDANNRRLVHQGLERIKKGHISQGLAALIEVAGKDRALLSAQDLGFALAPRINAAGRLSDMTLGIECLRSKDPHQARTLAQQLHEINQSRKEIESDMTEQALELAQSLIDDPQDLPSALCLFDPDFHEGVVGIVASRMKELYHRPTFVFAMSQAPGKEHLLKGSGRSIAGFHLRDALDIMSKRYPQLLSQFGGHAMAAGCTIEEDHLPLFEEAFQEVAYSLVSSEMLTQELFTDGPLSVDELSLKVAHDLRSQVWGQGFAQPLFVNEFEVLEQRVVGEKHLSVKLKFQHNELAGIWFGRTEPLPPKAHLAYRLECDEWRGVEKVKLFIACEAQS